MPARTLSTTALGMVPARCYDPAVPYDEALAGRVRTLLAGESAVSERRMFGGLAFLLEGNMTVAARSHGGLMVRLAADTAVELIEAGRAEPMVMRGRPMGGWVVVPESNLAAESALRDWVERALAFARTLPPKA